MRATGRFELTENPVDFKTAKLGTPIPLFSAGHVMSHDPRMSCQPPLDMERKLLPALLLLLLVLSCVTCSGELDGSVTPLGQASSPCCSFFVSPGGHDGAAGSRAAPFASLEHALAAARKETGCTSTTITLAAGVYRLSQTVRITAADAGPSHPLTIQASPGAVLSGGVVVSGWTKHGAMWRAPIPAGFTGGTAALRQLFVGGQRVPRPAAVLVGSVNATASAADVAVLPAASRPTAPALVGYITTDSSVRAWAPDTVEAVYNGTAQEWTEHRCGVARTVPVNATSTLIVMAQPCFEMAMRRSGWTEASPAAPGVGIPHYFENLRSALAPGQWCINSTAGTVDLKPAAAAAGESPGKHGAVAPALESLLHIAGASHVTIADVGFEHSAWHQPSTGVGYVSTQAGTFLSPASLHNPADEFTWNMMSSAVFVQNSSDVLVKNCVVQHVGGAGVTFSSGSANSTIRSSRFNDISGSAVQFAGTVGGQNQTLKVDPHAEAMVGLKATDNHIVNSPAEYHDAVGIFVGYTKGAIIAHNSLENLSYSGISIGWGWGQDAPGVGGNAVVNNSIKHYCTQLDDCGAIYTLSAQPDGLIARNHLHVAPILGCFGELPKCSNNQGIYHDAGSAFIVDRENVIDNGDCWLSLCGWDPGGCGIRNMTVRGNYMPTAAVKREGPICCCHGQGINGHSSVNGSSLADVIAGDNVEVKSAAPGGAPQWPAEALEIIHSAGARGTGAP